jgi:aspartate kinase
MMTDGNFSNAKIAGISTDRIFKSLGENKVVIIAGFQGLMKMKILQLWGEGVLTQLLWPWPLY